jgi:hypothetical protein
VFAQYNQAIWPAQVVAYALGLAAAAMLMRQGRIADLAIAGVLAAMWLWTGIAYHGLFFARINAAAYGFAVLFAAQGILLAVAALRGQLRFGRSGPMRGALGTAFIAYAAILYPLLGIASGHAYPAAPVFGVTPCPVTIFTFGMLLFARGPLVWWIAAIPLLWSLIGGSAAFLLNVPQDWLLLASGVLTIAIRASTREPQAR